MPVTNDRRPYTQSERLSIVRYLVDNNRYSEVKGRKVWQDMEEEKVTERSWQSMSEHFRKKIINMLHTFKLSQEERINFQLGFGRNVSALTSKTEKKGTEKPKEKKTKEVPVAHELSDFTDSDEETNKTKSKEKTKEKRKQHCVETEEEEEHVSKKIKTTNRNETKEPQPSSSKSREHSSQNSKKNRKLCVEKEYEIEEVDSDDLDLLRDLEDNIIEEINSQHELRIQEREREKLLEAAQQTQREEEDSEEDITIDLTEESASRSTQENISRDTQNKRLQCMDEDDSTDEENLRDKQKKIQEKNKRTEQNEKNRTDDALNPSKKGYINVISNRRLLISEDGRFSDSNKNRKNLEGNTREKDDINVVYRSILEDLPRKSNVINDFFDRRISEMDLEDDDFEITLLLDKSILVRFDGKTTIFTTRVLHDSIPHAEIINYDDFMMLYTRSQINLELKANLEKFCGRLRNDISNDEYIYDEQHADLTETTVFQQISSIINKLTQDWTYTITKNFSKQFKNITDQSIHDFETARLANRDKSKSRAERTFRAEPSSSGKNTENIADQLVSDLEPLIRTNREKNKYRAEKNVRAEPSCSQNNTENITDQLISGFETRRRVNRGKNKNRADESEKNTETITDQLISGFESLRRSNQDEEKNQAMKIFRAEPSTSGKNDSEKNQESWSSDSELDLVQINERRRNKFLKNFYTQEAHEEPVKVDRRKYFGKKSKNSSPDSILVRSESFLGFSKEKPNLIEKSAVKKPQLRLRNLNELQNRKVGNQSEPVDEEVILVSSLDSDETIIHEESIAATENVPEKSPFDLQDYVVQGYVTQPTTVSNQMFNLDKPSEVKKETNQEIIDLCENDEDQSRSIEESGRINVIKPCSVEKSVQNEVTPTKIISPQQNIVQICENDQVSDGFQVVVTECTNGGRLLVSNQRNIVQICETDDNSTDIEVMVEDCNEKSRNVVENDENLTDFENTTSACDKNKQLLMSKDVVEICDENSRNSEVISTLNVKKSAPLSKEIIVEISENEENSNEMIVQNDQSFGDMSSAGVKKTQNSVENVEVIASKIIPNIKISQSITENLLEGDEKPYVLENSSNFAERLQESLEEIKNSLSCQSDEIFEVISSNSHDDSPFAPGGSSTQLNVSVPSENANNFKDLSKKLSKFEVMSTNVKKLPSVDKEPSFEMEPLNISEGNDDAEKNQSNVSMNTDEDIVKIEDDEVIIVNLNESNKNDKLITETATQSIKTVKTYSKKGKNAVIFRDNFLETIIGVDSIKSIKTYSRKEKCNNLTSTLNPSTPESTTSNAPSSSSHASTLPGKTIPTTCKASCTETSSHLASCTALESETLASKVCSSISPENALPASSSGEQSTVVSATKVYSSKTVSSTKPSSTSLESAVSTSKVLSSSLPEKSALSSNVATSTEASSQPSSTALETESSIRVVSSILPGNGVVSSEKASNTAHSSQLEKSLPKNKMVSSAEASSQPSSSTSLESTSNTSSTPPPVTLPISVNSTMPTNTLISSNRTDNSKPITILYSYRHGSVLPASNLIPSTVIPPAKVYKGKKEGTIASSSNTSVSSKLDSSTYEAVSSEDVLKSSTTVSNTSQKPNLPSVEKPFTVVNVRIVQKKIHKSPKRVPREQSKMSPIEAVPDLTVNKSSKKQYVSKYNRKTESPVENEERVGNEEEEEQEEAEIDDLELLVPEIKYEILEPESNEANNFGMPETHNVVSSEEIVMKTDETDAEQMQTSADPIEIQQAEKTIESDRNDDVFKEKPRGQINENESEEKKVLVQKSKKSIKVNKKTPAKEIEKWLDLGETLVYLDESHEVEESEGKSDDLSDKTDETKTSDETVVGLDILGNIIDGSEKENSDEIVNEAEENVEEQIVEVSDKNENKLDHGEPTVYVEKLKENDVVAIENNADLTKKSKEKQVDRKKENTNKMINKTESDPEMTVDDVNKIETAESAPTIMVKPIFRIKTRSMDQTCRNNNKKTSDFREQSKTRSLRYRTRSTDHIVIEDVEENNPRGKIAKRRKSNGEGTVSQKKLKNLEKIDETEDEKSSEDKDEKVLERKRKVNDEEDKNSSEDKQEQTRKKSSKRNEKINPVDSKEEIEDENSSERTNDENEKTLTDHKNKSKKGNENIDPNNSGAEPKDTEKNDVTKGKVKDDSSRLQVEPIEKNVVEKSEIMAVTNSTEDTTDPSSQKAQTERVHKNVCYNFRTKKIVFVYKLKEKTTTSEEDSDKNCAQNAENSNENITNKSEMTNEVLEKNSLKTNDERTVSLKNVKDISDDLGSDTEIFISQKSEISSVKSCEKSDETSNQKDSNKMDVNLDGSLSDESEKHFQFLSATSTQSMPVRRKSDERTVDRKKMKNSAEPDEIICTQNTVYLSADSAEENSPKIPRSQELSSGSSVSTDENLSELLTKQTSQDINDRFSSSDTSFEDRFFSLG